MISRGLVALLFLLLPVSAQEPQPQRLPDGRLQSLAILKADYEKSKEDIAKLIELAQQLEEEIQKNQEFVVDLRSLRKVEDIEELAGRIKKRMKRF